MPVYEYCCATCSRILETVSPIGCEPPVCCGGVMTRRYTVDHVVIKMGAPLWTGRMDDIHKAQSQRGERLRFVHPSEIGAN